MTKIDIMQQQLQPVEQNVLDIYQYQALGLYNKLLKEKNILDYLWYLNSQGYSLPIEKEGDVVTFIGCSYDYMNQYKHAYRHTEIHYMFDTYVIGYCKKMLKAWHDRNIATIYWDRETRTLVEGSKSKITLSKVQRGILTKILKIENKRQKNLKKQSLL